MAEGMGTATEVAATAKAVAATTMGTTASMAAAAGMAKDIGAGMEDAVMGMAMGTGMEDAATATDMFPKAACRSERKTGSLTGPRMRTPA